VSFVSFASFLNQKNILQILDTVLHFESTKI
jgi:hypothetical protein